MLSEREKEVLQASFDFDGDLKRAADKLCVSICTIRSHLHRNIFKKFMVNSLHGAFRVGLALEVIDMKGSLKDYPPDLLVGDLPDEH